MAPSAGAWAGLAAKRMASFGSAATKAITSRWVRPGTCSTDALTSELSTCWLLCSSMAAWPVASASTLRPPLPASVPPIRLPLLAVKTIVRRPRALSGEISATSRRREMPSAGRLVRPSSLRRTRAPRTSGAVGW